MIANKKNLRQNFREKKSLILENIMRLIIKFHAIIDSKVSEKEKND